MTNQAVAPDTLDLLFDLTRGATDRQLEAGAAHDGKVTTLAGAASVILGIAALAAEPNRGLTIAAVAAYGVVVAATLFCIWPRKYEVVRHPDVLWEGHWNSTPTQIKHAIVARSAESYAKNRSILKQKVWGLLFALGATAAESVLIGLEVAGV